MSLSDALLESDKLRNEMLQLLDDKPIGTGRRSALVAAYFDIALEHHAAVLVLVKNELYGSASALIRPAFEAWLRAVWVAGCASDEDVEKVADDNSFEFPTDMVKQIDEKYKGDGFFAKIKKQSWKTMTGYSHPGQLAISRRFTGSTVKPNYEEGELIEIVHTSTLISLLLFRLVAIGAGLSAESQKSEEMLIMYTTQR
jgi:hypothetical protein